MGKRIKVGFTGAGWMGEQFIRRLASRSDTELVAVHDPNHGLRAPDSRSRVQHTADSGRIPLAASALRARCHHDGFEELSIFTGSAFVPAQPRVSLKINTLRNV
jgi:predicted dehydrogenase